MQEYAFIFVLIFLLQSDGKNLQRLGEAIQKAPFLPTTDKPDRYYNIIDSLIRYLFDNLTLVLHSLFNNNYYYYIITIIFIIRKFVVLWPFCSLIHNSSISKAINIWYLLKYTIINYQSFFAFHTALYIT